MDVFTVIKQLVQEGREWEARELFFEEAFPWLEELDSAVNSLLKRERPTPDPEVLWEKIRERLERKPP